MSARVILCSVAVGLYSLAAPSALRAQPPGLRDVSARFVANVNATPAAIGWKREVVRRGTDVRRILTRNGIRPDITAYTVLYSANPDLKDVDEVREGQVLVVPSVAQNAGEVTADQVAILEAFVATKQQLYGTISRTTDLINQIVHRVRETRESSYSDNFLDDVLAIQDIVRGVNFDELSLGQQTLETLDYELSSVANALGTSRETGNSGELEGLVRAVRSDLEHSVHCGRLAVNCEVEVQVRTWSAPQQPMNGLKVFAAPFGMVDAPDCPMIPKCKRPFRIDSSPARHSLSVGAHFVVWAERNGTRVTERKEITPARIGENIVDLTVR